MDKKNMVVKDNRLIEASYRFTLTEQRIILAAIIKTRQAQKGFSEELITIEAEWFAEQFGTDIKSCNIAPHLALRCGKNACVRLFVKLPHKTVVISVRNGPVL